MRFRDTESVEDRKHTFWVEADTEARFQQTVRRIGEEIQLEVSEPEDLFVSMNRWLSNSMNGPWIMVVDGLDNSAVAAALKRLLPRDSGQILITSKNRAILNSLDDFLPLHERKQVCLQIESLAVSESRRVFQWHNDGVLLSNSEMEDLFSKFSSPVLIKLLAKYFSNNNVTTSQLYKSIKDGKSLEFDQRVYEELSKEYLIFEPLINSMPRLLAPSIKSCQWPSAELRLLGELSCLNKDEIDFRLIQQNYENETRLLEMMGLLENCSYIGKGRNDNVQYYFMHETVQKLIRQWVLAEMGFETLLDLYATALCMLITLYKDDKSNEADAKKIRRSSYLWKLRFMAHFDRFLDFAREFSTNLDRLSHSRCSDRVVHCVITFSHVYLDEGRYDDAARVLELTRKLYKGTKYRPHLVRHLSKAYILRPLLGLHEEERSKAAIMLTEVISECVDPGASEQRWLCILDLADVSCKSLRPKDASDALERLQEVSVETNGGAPKLRRRGKKIFEETVELKLAIMKRIAEAKVHTARANCATNPAVRNKECRKAYEAYSDAKSAISSWLPGEGTWALEAEEQMAKVLCKMDNPDSTGEAIRIFEKLFQRLQADFHAPNRAWSQKRLWDIECQIACAQLRLGAGRVGPAVQTLERVLRSYEMCYGKRGGQHDEHTRACAHYLCEAYRKTGNASKAQEIEKRYSLLPSIYTRMPEVITGSRWFRKWFCAIILLFVMCILVYLHDCRYGATKTGEL